jgi:hypothetical protein
MTPIRFDVDDEFLLRDHDESSTVELRTSPDAGS